MADVAVLSEQIQGLTLMEAAQLVKDLEEKLGVSAAAAAPMAMMAAPAAAGGGEAAAAAEEQTEFTVTLKDAGAQKIKVIKVVRETTSLGHKEAKALVDEAPKPVKENVPKEEADDIVKKLQEVGAVAEIS